MAHKVHYTYAERGGTKFSWCGMSNPHHSTVSTCCVTCKNCIKAAEKNDAI